VTTQGTVAGAGKSLAITGNAVLGDAAGDTVTGLSSLAISGATTLGTDTVISTGTQTYGGAFSSDREHHADRQHMVTQGTVEGAGKSLTITGNAVLGNGASDTVTGLSSLAISGTTTLGTGTVTSTGTQTYGGALSLTENTTLTAAR
jgi:mucin-19